MIQLCAFLRALGGLFAEGVFRINGNSRVIENLRNAANLSMSLEDGDLFLAHLERYGDVHSVASLIKLFLRELPIGLVPPSHTKELLEHYNIHAEDSLVVIERIIRSLPPPNFRLLEYLCCFLRQVMQYQSQNKMNSTSIGIIFGPNVFRIPRESEGLTSQSVINHIMSVLVERSDVLFVRKSPLEVPLRLPMRRDHSAVDTNPNSLVDCEEATEGVPVEGHRRSTVNYRPKPRRSHSSRSPFLDTEPIRNPFTSGTERGRRGRENQVATSPSDMESQSMVLNLATDVAEQLSATLQACLRTCVRQHALPSSHRRSQHSPHHSSVTSSPHWLGDRAVGHVSLLSPLCAFSHSTHPSSIPPTVSNTSQINGSGHSGAIYMRKLRDSTPPPQSEPEAEFGESSRANINQEDTDFASDPSVARSGDMGSDEAQHLQDVGFIVSSKHPDPRRILDSGRRPTAERTVEEQRKEEEGHFGARLATYGPALERSPQFRTPFHPLQESRPVECIMKAYDEIVQRLAEKRRVANRPERPIDMTLQELETEKLVIQRALLAFETAYGRPRERNDRVVMRPVYDRYRSVKRLLAGAASHHCSSPNTPARAFAPPDMLDSATGATNTAAPLATPHSLYSEHVSSLALHTELPLAGASDPVALTYRCLSIDTSNYPHVHNSVASSRCTSLVTSTNSKTPDEWFGSLGVSTRPSSQRMQSPLRYSEVEQVGEGECNTGVLMRKGGEVAMSKERVEEIEEESEEQTVGRRTPINRSPLLALSPSPSPPPSPPTYQQPRRRQQRRQHAEASTSTALPRAQWSVVGHDGAHSQLLSQPPRQLTLFPTAFSRRHHSQHHQHQIGLLVGDDPESGKPLEQAIADCVAKYATFTLSELQMELNTVKDSKKTLQKFLKEFEHDFEKKHGRKVEIEDRQPLNPEYLHYKMLKARLTSLERLLEARSTKV
ncbi:Protein FAM13A [Taenia crassiceps]|uniref:Protein FAM13A n=1 Tax=Taenia crassiceps TaxID=6207 RepID=A0ABR4QT64_9CEST